VGGKEKKDWEDVAGSTGDLSVDGNAEVSSLARRMADEVKRKSRGRMWRSLRVKRGTRMSQSGCGYIQGLDRRRSGW
jgi:hypothetical protein